MGKLLLPLAGLFRYLHQYKSEHWGETASVFQTVLSTHDQKALDRNPQAVWTQSKHHSLCPCRQFSSSSQLIISAATYSTHPLQFQRKFPLSLFFFSEPLFNPQATISFLLIYSFWYHFVCVCFVKNKRHCSQSSWSTFPPAFQGNFAYCFNPILSEQKTPLPHTHIPLPL